MNEREMYNIMDRLKSMLTPKRFEHSIGVRDTAVELAKIYQCDVEKASIAGMLHDCAKNIDVQQMLQMCQNFGILLDSIEKIEYQLIHGPLGAKVAQQEFNIIDHEILDAIYYHTVGKENMPMLTKIVYLADYIEPNRNFPGVDELRLAAKTDINRAIIMATDSTIRYILSKSNLIHPDTIKARNYILLHEMGTKPKS